MNYIRSCIQCNAELRFPIDKGVIQVRCPACGTFFIVNPDDPKLYQTGKFDIDTVLATQHKKSDIDYPEYNSYFKQLLRKLKQDKTGQDFLIKLLLFSMLFGYILRGCSNSHKIYQQQKNNHSMQPDFQL